MCAAIRTKLMKSCPLAVRKSKKIMNPLCNRKKSIFGKTCLVGVALFCAAMASNALTLGRLRGAALLGQPLDVSVAVQPGAGEDVSGLCFEAEIFYGDTRIDPSRFRVKLDSASQPQNPSVRIASSVPVDEPVVTVNLRAGCAQKMSRRYVLLADQASDVIPATAPVQAAGPGVTTTPAATSTMTSQDGQAVPGPGGRPADTPKSSTQTRLAKNRFAGLGPVRAPKVVPNFDLGNPGVTGERRGARQTTNQVATPIQSRRQRQAAKTGKPLLKLDAADLPLEGDVALRLSQQLNVAAIGNEKLRSEAAALWLAINANPLDILRESQRVKSLESDVATLRTLTGKSQQTLADLTQRLQKAESERRTNGMAYLLAGLAALALVAATYFWSRQRRQSPGAEDWWHSSQSAKDSVNLDPHVPQSGQPHAGRSTYPHDAAGAQTLTDPGPAQAKPAPAHARGANASSSFGDGSDVDIDLDLPMPSTPPVPAAHTRADRPAASSRQAPRQSAPGKRALGTVGATSQAAFATLPPASTDSRAFPPSMGAALRAINTEELLDIRQQADFFLSLGQYDRAIQILEARIHERAESSPLVYLDLLKLLHALDRIGEYQRFENDFNQRFRGRAVSFSEFGAEGEGLESHEDLVTRLSQVWPSEQALDLMESHIFRNEGGRDGPTYDLAAFRELLMLHAIARELVSDDRRYSGLKLDIALN